MACAGDCGIRTWTKGDTEMSVGNKTSQQQLEKGSKAERGSVTAASRRGHGMRVGLLEDWRAGGAKAASEIAERGKRLRDGR